MRRRKSSSSPDATTVLSAIKKTGFFRKRKGLYLLITVIILLIPFFFKDEIKTEVGGVGGGAGGEYAVEGIIDGDTVILQDADNTRLRYLGMDAPEILTEESPGDPLSEEAASLNGRFVGGKKIKLEFDEEKYDDYGRTLAYVFVDGVFVNQEIIRNGLARALIIKPNDKYADAMYEAEEEAKQARKGIWGDLDRLNSPQANSEFLVKPSQASRHIGQRVVVRGKITDFRKSKAVTALSMEDELDVVIFSGDRENFEFFGITPEQYYTGKPVEVTGRVKMYKGRAQIIIAHPISIRGLR